MTIFSGGWRKSGWGRPKEDYSKDFQCFLYNQPNFSCIKKEELCIHQRFYEKWKLCLWEIPPACKRDYLPYKLSNNYILFNAHPSKNEANPTYEVHSVSEFYWSDVIHAWNLVSFQHTQLPTQRSSFPLIHWQKEACFSPQSSNFQSS